ncbi:MAG: hypothetical protein AAFQ94_15930 [Bacteroidota bacterium]
MKKFLSVVSLCLLLSTSMSTAQSLAGDGSCTATRTCKDQAGFPDGSVSCSGADCERTDNGVKCDGKEATC